MKGKKEGREEVKDEGTEGGREGGNMGGRKEGRNNRRKKRREGGIGNQLVLGGRYAADAEWINPGLLSRSPGFKSQIDLLAV